MKTLMTVMLFLISLPPGTFAQSQDGSLKIEGPDIVAPGKLVRLTATTLPEESPFWIVLSPVDLDFEQVDEGRKLIFASGCQARKSIVVLLLAQTVKQGRVVTRQVRREIKIVDPDDSKPDPGDDEPDGNNPGEGDPGNDPLFTSVVDGLSRMTDPAARAKRTLVAANFESIAARCQSGQMGDIPAIWLTLSRLNHASIAPHHRSWERLAQMIQTEFKRRGLATVADHTKPLLAVAAALRNGGVQ